MFEFILWSSTMMIPEINYMLNATDNTFLKLEIETLKV